MQCNGYTLFFNKSFSNGHKLLSYSFQKKIEVFAIIEDNILAIHNTHKRILINLSEGDRKLVGYHIP